MIENWILFAILAAVSWAGCALISEYFKVRSLHLLLWMRLFLVIGLTPIALQFEMPTDIFFYLPLIGTVLCFSYSDLIYFSKATDSGAGMVTRLESLTVGAAFILWLVVDPALVQSYLETPLRTTGIVASLIGGIYFALKLRKCALSFSTLRAMMPALLIGGLGVVFGKTAMLHSDYHSGVWYYVFLQSLLVLIVYIIVLSVPSFAKFFPSVHTKQGFFKKRTIIAALCVAGGWAIHTPSKYYAITDVENPAYVTVIGLTAPFWVLMIYKLIRRQEKADILSGLGIVLCAISLVIFTQF